MVRRLQKRALCGCQVSRLAWATGARAFHNSRRASHATSSSTPLPDRHWTARLASRSVIAITGHDASKLLQGLITNHMPLIERGGDGFYTAFLNPQGRILFDVFIYPKNNGIAFPNDPPTFLIEGERERLGDLTGHIKKFLLRAKCKIDDSINWHVWQAWGPRLGIGVPADQTQRIRVGTPGTGGSQVPIGGMILKDERVADCGCIDRRSPTMGIRMVLPEGQSPKVKGLTLEEVDQDEYTLHRMLNGVPENARELVPASSLPLESNFDFMAGVDFRKGCYVGQELTVRTYHTGVIRKRIMPMALYDTKGSPPATLKVERSDTPLSLALESSEIKKVVDENDGSGMSRPRSAGRFLSGIHNVGIGLFRLESAEAAEKGQATLALDGGRLVKPFTPSWWPRPQEFSKSGAGPGQQRMFHTSCRRLEVAPSSGDASGRYQSILRDRFKKRNQSLLMYGAATILLTLSLSYAAVPLYRAFCSATGYSGTPSTDLAKFTPDRLIPRPFRTNTESDGATAGKERRLKITFNASTSDALPWSFVPQQRQVLVLPGESALAFYTAKNKSDRDIIGMATYNIIPDRAAPYFNKIQCFCFEEQKLLKGEEVDMPVLFFIDPDFIDDPLLEDVHTITLSYTFFAAKYNEKGHLVPVA